MSSTKLLTEWLAFDYDKDMIKESREANSGKIIMKGILQKADTLNQNGRIYPAPILEREVRNYQKFINENTLLNQPFVKDPSTSLSKIIKGNEVLSYNRYEVGEGLEKKSEDFAQEVYNQIS